MIRIKDNKLFLEAKPEEISNKTLDEKFNDCSCYWKMAWKGTDDMFVVIGCQDPGKMVDQTLRTIGRGLALWYLERYAKENLPIDPYVVAMLSRQLNEGVLDVVSDKFHKPEIPLEKTN